MLIDTLKLTLGNFAINTFLIKLIECTDNNIYLLLYGKTKYKNIVFQNDLRVD